jgi:gamma-glutamyl phosphate reductase
VGIDMVPQSNFKARQLSSHPQTHRSDVLSSIASKNHATSSRIIFLNTESSRIAEELSNVPDDMDSRLDWISKQLHRD